jgi:hypothetical protein
LPWKRAATGTMTRLTKPIRFTQQQTTKNPTLNSTLSQRHKTSCEVGFYGSNYAEAHNSCAFIFFLQKTMTD